ncbi:MAG TPA: hypothetical protein VL443_00365 [Cyclobacteriaceae bacterium]|jgi:hypothetical protein|nr:hypothetical protein [Cyclobacteriaceae bacterium]
MKKLYILILLFPFLLTPALAQKKKRSKEPKNKVSVAPFFAIPNGKLALNYNGSVGFQAGFFHTFTKKKSRFAPTVGAMLNYTRLQSKGDTLHFPVTDINGDPAIGSSYYTPFTMVQVKISGGMRFTLLDNLYLTPGAELGYVIGKRDSYINDGYSDSSDSEIKTWLLLAPKVNIEYKVNKHFSVEPFVAYNLIIQTGSTDTNSTDYNPDTGKTYSYLTPGVSLNFLF